MTDLESDIRVNIDALRKEIQQLQDSAREEFKNPDKVRLIMTELRTRLDRLDLLRRNLEAATSKTSLPPVAETNN